MIKWPRSTHGSQKLASAKHDAFLKRMVEYLLLVSGEGGNSGPGMACHGGVACGVKQRTHV